jgi:predicted secreted acid phosphatase
MLSVSEKISNIFNKFIPDVLPLVALATTTTGVDGIEDFQKKFMVIESLQPYIHFLKSKSKIKYERVPVVIFDIDGTLVDFWTQEAIEPTIDFYNKIIKLGYHTIILTARLKDMKNQTIKKLNQIGIKNYDQIIFRDYLFENIADYKLNQRKKLATNYDIVANVGDRITDFKGGYNGKIIKIPS